MSRERLLIEGNFRDEELAMNGKLVEKPQEELTTIEPTRSAPMFAPRFDIVETEHELTLYGDLPGVQQDQLDVRYENEQLLVHGKVLPRSEEITFVRQEFEVGDFHRTFSIGESVDAARISAEVRNGVLIIHLPKSEAVKPKRIPVKAV